VTERPTQHRITDLAESERPRERLAKLGPQALSNSELLAILLRVGIEGESAVQVGQRLLSQFDGISGLHRASFEDLHSAHGMGPAKAAQIKAAIELGRRLSLESPEDRVTIQSPADAAALVQYEMSALVQEQLRTILMNTRNQVLDIKTLYQGSLNSAQCESRGGIQTRHSKKCSFNNCRPQSSFERPNA
jgi:DNA repair protein RadC